MADSNIVTIRAGGQAFDVDLWDIDGLEWRDVKQATGLSNEALVRSALVERDFVALAGLVWIWRRRTEPGLTFEAVLKPMSYRPEPETTEVSPDPPD